ncbi:MAG: hypothetical protein WDA27_02985 [Actinomycetota bacterium]
MKGKAMRRATVMLFIAGFLMSLMPAQAVSPLLAGAVASDNIDFVANIPDAPAIGARIIGNLMYVTGSQGVRIYDISKGLPILQGALELPHFENEDVDTNGKILLIAADHAFSFPTNVLYVIDVSNPLVPMLLSATTTASGHTAACILDCRYAWLSGASAPGIEVIDLADPTRPRRLGRFGPASHAVSVDPTGIAWVSAWDGLYAYDLNGYDPEVNPEPKPLGLNGWMDRESGFHNKFIIHNTMRPYADLPTPAQLADNKLDKGELVVVTEENWTAATNGMCKDDGQFQTGWYRTVDGVARVDKLGAFSIGTGTISEAKKPAALVACSSHFFDYKDEIVVDGWYEQGLRLLDVSDPLDIRQVGYYMPAVTEVWAAKFNVVGAETYIYTFDAARGIDVLKFTGAAGDPAALAPRFNTMTGRFSRPTRDWGYLCRLHGLGPPDVAVQK